MPSCDRCGIPHKDDDRAADRGGAELQEAFDGVYCMACIDWLQEHSRTGRSTDQRGLGEYG